MTKIINLDEVKDDKLQTNMDKTLKTLGNLNRLPGLSQAEFDAMIDYALDRLKSAMVEYYNGCYDEDEPNIATCNLNALIDDLIDVAECNARVVRD